MNVLTVYITVDELWTYFWQLLLYLFYSDSWFTKAFSIVDGIHFDVSIDGVQKVISNFLQIK